MSPLIGMAVTTKPLWWAAKLAGETVERVFDVATLTAPIAAGTITALSVQIAPSGAGELSAEDLTVFNTVISLREASGVEGRVYAVRFTATLLDGEIAQWIVYQGVAPEPPPESIPLAPVPGYGAEIIWMPSSNNVSSGALESGLILSGLPCSLINVQANVTEIGGWIMLLDAAIIPSPGAVTPIRWWQIQANSTLPMQLFSPPLTTVNGAVLLFSTALDPFTFTPSETALFAGEIA